MAEIQTPATQNTAGQDAAGIIASELNMTRKLLALNHALLGREVTTEQRQSLELAVDKLNIDPVLLQSAVIDLVTLALGQPKKAAAPGVAERQDPMQYSEMELDAIYRDDPTRYSHIVDDRERILRAKKLY